MSSVEAPLLGVTEVVAGSSAVDIVDHVGSETHDLEGATILQATFNLVNIYMGLGLLSMAFAMRCSGWLGLAALVAMTGVFCTSGKLLVRAFQALPQGVPHTYPNLGVRAIGPSGKYVVAVFTVLEFFGGSCIMLVVLWKEFVELLPEHAILGVSPFQFAVGTSMLCLLPVIFIPSFKNLSWLNLLGCLSTILVTLTMLSSVVLDPHRSKMPIQPPAGHDLIRLGIFQAIGIFALSVSGHSSLPVLRNSMKRPQDFEKVMDLAFLSMLVLYGVVAGCGYYYFGWNAHELVTVDLASNSPLKGVSLLVPGLTINKLVSACILVNAFTTYPSLLMVIQDMICSVTSFGIPRLDAVPLYFFGTALRLATFFISATLAFSAYGFLGDVMSLSGGFCSISCSLLVPSLFFLVLYKRQLKPIQTVLVVALLGLGVALLVLITAQNVMDIVEKERQSAKINTWLHVKLYS